MRKRSLCFVIAILLVLSVALTTACTITSFATEDDTEIMLAYQVGDVNLDEEINIRDATAIQKYLAKFTDFTLQQLELADADENGIVSIKDATYIQKLIAGLIEVTNPTDEESTTEKMSAPLRGNEITNTTSVTGTAETDSIKTEATTETVPVEASTASTEPSSVTDATVPTEENKPAEITEATEATEEEDDFKPITLPFVPAP